MESCNRCGAVQMACRCPSPYDKPHDCTAEIIAELERAKYACYEENCWDDLPEERQKGINQIIDHITNKLKAKETQL